MDRRDKAPADRATATGQILSYSIPVGEEDIVTVLSCRTAVIHSTPVGPRECSGPACPFCRQGLSSRIKTVYMVISSVLDPPEREYVPMSGEYEAFPDQSGKWHVHRVSPRKYVWSKYNE